MLGLRMGFIRMVCVKLKEKDGKYGSMDFVGFENSR